MPTPVLMMSNKHYEPIWVTNHLAVGAAPMSYAQLEALHDAGITCILNLCGEFFDLHNIESAAGFEVYHMPLADEEAPVLAELEKALAWLDEAIYLGKMVLIHCRHGIGRTGTVLNGYLLRRGLGHRQAWLKLRKLRSKPANFNQWWTIRKYGRNSPKLTIREPSLEFRHLVDLQPFFSDYESLTQSTDARFEAEQSSGGCCGRDHIRCCSTPIRLTLIEASYLTQRINSQLSSSQRLEIIEKAVATARLERAVGKSIGEGQYCLATSNSVCPLLCDGSCLLFSFRPLQCRTYGLKTDISSDLWDNILLPALNKLSCEIWLAVSGTIVPDEIPGFALADVVSGRYIQVLFHLMIHQSSS